MQLALFVYKYHTEVGIAFPYSGSLSSSGTSQLSSEVVLPAAQQQQQQPVIVYSGASGAGALIGSSGLSAAEIDNMLKPGSSGHSPFDAPRYAGFCRKMRVRRGWDGCVAAPLMACWPVSLLSGWRAMYHRPWTVGLTLLRTFLNPCCPAFPALLLRRAAAQRAGAGGAAHVAHQQAAQCHGRHHCDAAIWCAALGACRGWLSQGLVASLLFST